MELKLKRRLFHKEDIEEDKSIDLIYYKDLSNNKEILETYKAISRFPLDKSRKIFLKQGLFTGNYFAVYKLNNPTVIVYKFPNDELRFFLISSESNLIEANDSSFWDPAFSFIKSTRESIIFSMPNIAHVETDNRPWLYNPDSGNYTHFCIDYFSPLSAFTDSKIIDKIGQDVECPQFIQLDWQKEYYDLLVDSLASPHKINFNSSYRSLTEQHKNKDAIFVFKLQTLYMPVIPNVRSSAEYLRYFLNEKLNSYKSNTTQSSLLFLTRNDIRRQRIKNIDLIESMVHNLGGDVINPTMLNLREKAATFSQYKCILAESSGCVNYWLLANSDARLIAMIDCNALQAIDLLIGGLTYMTIRSYQTSWLIGYDYEVLKGSPLGSCTYDIEKLVAILSN